jgi:hypothetical protein
MMTRTTGGKWGGWGSGWEEEEEEEEETDPSIMVFEDEMVIKAITHACIAAGAAILGYTSPHYNKIPYHTSAPTGTAWVCELLEGHLECIWTKLSVHKDVFELL